MDLFNASAPKTANSELFSTNVLTTRIKLLKPIANDITRSTIPPKAGTSAIKELDIAINVFIAPPAAWLATFCDVSFNLSIIFSIAGLILSINSIPIIPTASLISRIASICSGFSAIALKYAANANTRSFEFAVISFTGTLNASCVT